ncbi:hypothetical protein DY000_02006416 [Brassica cretica]|uniref:Retrotransposon gag domain-containing protein n=1 Tax=Brassica cretica TaxID=69181 RepID=A0ABQ7C3Q4_BRACR|nr:hypothetical protein DY000_02006416 [Brassica cretica]
MPPRRRVVHTHAASASREGGDENVPQPVPPIDQDALRQMVQDAARQAAQEAVQQAVREAARVAAQEVVRQMVSAQKGQHVPPVQFQGHQQPLFSRFRQFRFRGINSPDFLVAFDKKYFPRETLHQKKTAFEHLRQGTRSVREYEREFCQLCLFDGNNFDAENLIRRFLDRMQVDLRGRCSMVTYTSLEDLVEKAAMQEACIAEEQKFSKAAQPKSGKREANEAESIVAGTERLGTTGVHRDVPVLLGGVDFIGDLAEMELDYYDVIQVIHNKLIVYIKV